MSTSNNTDYMVHCIRTNVYRYSAAKDVCKRLNGRLASVDEVHQACSNGASWDTLGWCQGSHAYDCRNGQMKGGKLPGQVKLGVYCFSRKPNALMQRELRITSNV
jgi:hypothetical protein